MKKNVGGTIRLLAVCMLCALACLQAMPAWGAIVYSGVKNLVIGHDNSSIVNVDLNKDGDTDVQFKNVLVADSSSPDGTVVNKVSYNFVMAQGTASIGGYYSPISGMPVGMVNFAGTDTPGPPNFWINQSNYLTLSMFPPIEPYGTILNLAVYDKNPSAITVTLPGAPYSFQGTYSLTYGYLQVRFMVDGNLHYGWIQYSGPVAAQNTDAYTGTIVDWAYESTVGKQIEIGELPCIDNDGDGYGEGPGCVGPDPDDTNPDIIDNSTVCGVALTPGTISKAFSWFFSRRTITIRSLDNVTLTKDSTIDWGTSAIETVNIREAGDNTIQARVKIKPLSLIPGDQLTVQVDDCTGVLNIK